jgi:predicted lipoprotein with Yx(FWY)xxD motif
MRPMVDSAVHRFRLKGMFVVCCAMVGAFALAAVPAFAHGRAEHHHGQAKHHQFKHHQFKHRQVKHSKLPAGAVVINSAGSGSANVGRVLVNSKGFSLYDFTGDGLEGVTSCLATNVSGGAPCTNVWVPVIASGPLVAGPGVSQALLGTEQRIEGPGDTITQVTYAGEPLYTFVKDTAAGQTNGQDVTAFLGFWRLVSNLGGAAVDRHVNVNLELSTTGPVIDTPTAGANRSLYLLSADPAGQTSCTGPCAAAWPPLLTKGAPIAGTGVNKRLLGTIRRPDGHFQVTYGGMPVYLFAFDLAKGGPGPTLGNNLIDTNALGIWDTISPSATAAPGSITIADQTGSMFVGADGGTPMLSAPSATVYTFSADTATSSQCTGACAVVWPPVLTSGPPVAGMGVTSSQLGTIQRADGNFQVTYNGKPLYYFGHALDTGDEGNGITAFGGTFTAVPAS